MAGVRRNMCVIADAYFNSEIEDCTREWTFEPESMDFVHMRLLIGSIPDWYALFAEAYKTLKPGGWIESYEGRMTVESDDGTVTETSAMSQWGRIFIHFGETIGRSFTIVEDEVQRKAMQAAGFVDIREEEYKVRWVLTFALTLTSLSFLVVISHGL